MKPKLKLAFALQKGCHRTGAVATERLGVFVDFECPFSLDGVRYGVFELIDYLGQMFEGRRMCILRGW